MDFTFTPKQEAFRQELISWLSTHVPPRVIDLIYRRWEDREWTLPLPPNKKPFGRS